MAQFVKLDFVFDPQPDRHGVELFPSSSMRLQGMHRDNFTFTLRMDSVLVNIPNTNPLSSCYKRRDSL